MSELPERPNLRQLRRQAKELLRAAVAGEPEALGRLRAVSNRVTLAAAQLAIAREYGLSSWPALHAEVARRRLSAPLAPVSATEIAAGLSRLTPARRSLGGSAAIDTAAGTLSVRTLIAGPGRAFVDASLMPSAQTERQLAGRRAEHLPGLRFLTGMLGGRSRRHARWHGPSFNDVTAGDDHAEAVRRPGSRHQPGPRSA